ncbi:hypothetical protein FRX31_029764 [Thalictrum thalictroides]|uniref:Uncharacterized protein n=1 Tax=Thalictrum thalictroides TaxID=46969 RepID=A0A7J6V7A3_THATH|nr:hypothetical protein FRX31_029764 [Thalictrum thalictroides]
MVHEKFSDLMESLSFMTPNQAESLHKKTKFKELIGLSSVLMFSDLDGVGNSSIPNVDSTN